MLTKVGALVSCIFIPFIEKEVRTTIHNILCTGKEGRFDPLDLSRDL